MASKFKCPKLTTERFGKPPYINCVFSSGVMLRNKGGKKQVPNTSAEVIKLRKASGQTHASANPHDLIVAFAKVYHWVLTEFNGSYETLLAKLQQGNGAALFIHYGLLPTHYRRWDPQFDDGHCVYIQGTSPAGGTSKTKTWLMDPLAPKGYKGEWIDNDDLRRATWNDGTGIMAITLKNNQFAG